MAAATGSQLRVAALAFVALGVLLRLIGIDWGLPAIYDPDEPDFVNRALVMLDTGNLDPGWFGHPGSATMYSFLAAFAAYAVTFGGGVAAAVEAYAVDPSRFFLLARLVIAAFAAATLVLTWRFARRSLPVSATAESAALAGLVAVGLLALAPLHTQFSRNARPDIEMVFFVTLSVFAAIGIATRGRWRDYLAAGFCLGLGIATKYPAAIFAPLLLLAHLLGQHDRAAPAWHGLERLVGAGAAVVAGVAVGAPFLLLSPEVALGDIRFEARSYHLSGTSAGFASSLLSYLFVVLPNEFGWPGMALVAMGAFTALTTRARGAQLALAALLLFVPVMASLELRWDRWMLPAVPFGCVLAGVGAAQLWRLIAPVSGGVRASLAAAVLTVLAVAGPAFNSLPWTVANARGDSRDAAAAWIGANVEPLSRVLLEAYTPQLGPDRYRLYNVSGGRIWPLDANGRRLAVPSGVIGTLANVDEIERYRMDYIVIANHYDRRLAEAARYPQDIALYQEIMQRHELVFEADAAPWQAIGLPVRVYRVRR